MFFLKALGGCLLVVFSGLFFMGFFDHEQAVLNAVETVRQAEIEDNKNARWGPECDGLRDKYMGVQGGAPVGLAGRNALESIAKLQAAERRLKEAGCDIDAAPGAINPFDKSRDGGFRPVTTTLSDDPADNIADGSEWGGDPNAFNEGGSDDWGINE